MDFLETMFCSHIEAIEELIIEEPEEKSHQISLLEIDDKLKEIDNLFK